jgi:hypothetical protein
LQDVFELKYAKMPEEPPQTDPTPPPSVSGTVKSEDQDLTCTDEDDHDGVISEEEREAEQREARIRELQKLVSGPWISACISL